MSAANHNLDHNMKLELVWKICHFDLDINEKETEFLPSISVKLARPFSLARKRSLSWAVIAPRSRILSVSAVSALSCVPA